MQQKGQIPIIILVIVVIAFIFLKGGFGLDFFKDWFGSFKINSSSPQQNKQPILPKLKAVTPPSAEKSETLPDTTPAKRSNPQPTGELPADTRQIAISLATDQKAVCKYGDTSGLAYNSMQYTFSNTNATSHLTTITTLSEGQEYKYYIKCADESGNQNIDDFIISFKIKAPDDTAPPQRFYLDPSGVLPYWTKETTIGVSTNEPASCRYSLVPGESYYSMSSDQYKKRHTANVSGLKSGKTYDYFVRCRDLAGNENTGDAMISFSIGE